MSDIVYGPCSDSYNIKKWRNEFDDLLNLQELGFYEWKDSIVKLQQEMNKQQSNSLSPPRSYFGLNKKQIQIMIITIVVLLLGNYLISISI